MLSHFGPISSFRWSNDLQNVIRNTVAFILSPKKCDTPVTICGKSGAYLFNMVLKLFDLKYLIDKDNADHSQMCVRSRKQFKQKYFSLLCPQSHLFRVMSVDFQCQSKKKTKKQKCRLFLELMTPAASVHVLFITSFGPVTSC